MKGVVNRVPERDDAAQHTNEQLTVEFYTGQFYGFLESSD